MKSLLVLFVFAAAVIAGQSAGTASIQGRIVRAGTNEPVAGVRVTGENIESRHQSSATTDATGAFALTGLGPASYRLTFVARGYVDAVYGQKIASGPWTSLEIAAGQAVKDLIVRMTPTGSVEGRVRDSNGAPAVGADRIAALELRRRRTEGP